MVYSDWGLTKSLARLLTQSGNSAHDLDWLVWIPARPRAIGKPAHFNSLAPDPDGFPLMG